MAETNNKGRRGKYIKDFSGGELKRLLKEDLKGILKREGHEGKETFDINAKNFRDEIGCGKSRMPSICNVMWEVFDEQELDESCVIQLPERETGKPYSYLDKPEGSRLEIRFNTQF